MLRHQSIATNRYSYDVTYANPQAVGHMRAGSADRDGLAASRPEARKSSHDAWPGQVSFDERSYKLATLAVEKFGRVVKGGSHLIDLQRTVFPSNLCDHSGRDLMPSAPVQTCTEGPPGC